ncbi:MAG: Gfo/Idh/MocA family oxidoreductase [Planctomycetaceae bacterium]|jgi:predicted dehydrogenase|nr:Gfo/Idh/MocA family oxidoreductase [Planctomycetaceae bacterium]
MNKPTRRDFLKTTAVTGVGFWVAAGSVKKPLLAQSPNERLGVACVGVGGKGGGDIDNASKWGEIVGLCDVDKGRLAGAKKTYQKAETFTDFREMLDKLDKSTDVVIVSTPDHTHAPASLKAMRMKKHVYCQKPLTRTIYEARLMGTVAKETGVCTQLGNQGAAQDSLREAVAQVQAGMVGTIKDVHVWSNRPVWPQGLNVVRKSLSTYEEEAKKKAEETNKKIKEQADYDPADLVKPEELVEAMKKDIDKQLTNLDWDLWIGAGKFREFWPGLYHAFSWRGWWDFGSGALGDMACHTFNMPFYACDLRNPTSVQAITSGHNRDAFPQRSKIFFEFPATEKRPAVTVTWYDGGNKPSKDLFEQVGVKRDVSGSGALIIGDKGALFTGDDYCGGWEPVGCEKLPDVTFTKTPHPEGGMDRAQSAELYEAILQNKPEICSGSYAQFGGPLTETILLGNLAVWAAATPDEMGEKVEWDAVNLKIRNNVKTPGTADLIKPVYRKGYDLDV